MCVVISDYTNSNAHTLAYFLSDTNIVTLLLLELVLLLMIVLNYGMICLVIAYNLVGLCG